MKPELHQTWLENPRNGIEVLIANHLFLWSIFQHAMFDYQRVGGCTNCKLNELHAEGQGLAFSLHGFRGSGSAAPQIRQSNTYSHSKMQ